MPTYNFNFTNSNISFVNGNGVYYNIRLREEDATTSSIDSQEQDCVKETNPAVSFEEAMGF